MRNAKGLATLERRLRRLHARGGKVWQEARRAVRAFVREVNARTKRESAR